MIKRINQLFALWQWKYLNGYWWWQQSKPVVEFESEIVEGKPGEGKTRYLALRAIKAMRQGFIVASNFEVRDRLTGAKSIPIANWLDVLRLTVEAVERNTAIVFVIDELHLWADSRSFSKTPLWWRMLMAQHRHFGIGILGATQSLSRVEVVLREIVSTLSRIRNKVILRLPIFAIEKIDPSSVPINENGLSNYELMSGYLFWQPWYVGYSTQQMIDLECWATDEEIDNEIELLTTRLLRALKPEHVQSFVDQFPGSSWELTEDFISTADSFSQVLGLSYELPDLDRNCWSNPFAAGNGLQEDPIPFDDYSGQCYE